MHLTRQTIVLIVCICYCGCSNGPSPYYIPDQMTLFSIRGSLGASVEATPDTERFCGKPVLGKIEVTEAKQRRAIIEGLNDAINRRPEKAPDCFNPRHGLKWKENGQVREFVICFECSLFIEYQDGKKVRFDKINWSLDELLPGMLTTAKIPMEPGPTK